MSEKILINYIIIRNFCINLTHKRYKNLFKGYTTFK